MTESSVITTLILIRHAERESSPGNDPHLNAHGRTRANSLVRILGNSEIKAIYTSRFIRTRETAAPLANHLGISPLQIDEAANLKTHILENHAGKHVLVVGHSDTIPELIGLLGSGGLFDIHDNEFDNLFVLMHSSTGTSSAVRLKYEALS